MNKGTPWTRICRRCKQSKLMVGGLTRNNGRWWCCAECRRKEEQRTKEDGT